MKRSERRAKRNAGNAPLAASPTPSLHLPALARRWRWLVAYAFVLAALAFAPAIRGPLLFDDIDAIAQNRTLATVWPPRAALTPPPRTSVSGRPLVNFTFAVNGAINRALGIDDSRASRTVSFHVGNVGIHLLCGWVLLLFLRRALRGTHADAETVDMLAACVTAIWIVHPIQTEAVDYITQRTELLVSFFYLSTLYASLRSWDADERSDRIRWQVAALVACVLGMASKEVMATAPIAVVLSDRAFRATSWRALRSRAPLYVALTCALAVLAAVAVGARADSAGFNAGMAWYEYLLSQGWAIPHYLTLLVWPVGLTFDYGEQAVVGWGSVVGICLLAIGGLAALAAWRRNVVVAFWATWFFLILAPSSSFVPIRTEIAAERRMYLALAPVLVLVMMGLIRLTKQTRVLPMAAAALVMLFAGIAAQRSRVYQSAEAIWRHTIAVRPTNARGYDQLAALLVLQKPSRLSEAEALYKQAIASDSTYIPAWTNLADVKTQQGLDADALVLLERVVRINPEAIEATRRYGSLLVKVGDVAKGLPLLERANREIPTEDGLATAATAYASLGRFDAAGNALRAVLALNPARTDASAYLGSLLTMQGKPDEAIPHLAPLAPDPNTSPMVLATLSLALAQVGRTDDAIRVASVASARATSDGGANLLLGRAMITLDRLSDADAYLTTAVRLMPTDPEPVTRLGMVQAAMNRKADAARSFQRALALQPRYPAAVAALERLGNAR